MSTTCLELLGSRVNCMNCSMQNQLKSVSAPLKHIYQPNDQNANDQHNKTFIFFLCKLIRQELKWKLQFKLL